MAARKRDPVQDRWWGEGEEPSPGTVFRNNQIRVLFGVNFTRDTKLFCRIRVRFYIFWLYWEARRLRLP